MRIAITSNIFVSLIPIQPCLLAEYLWMFDFKENQFSFIYFYILLVLFAYIKVRNELPCTHPFFFFYSESLILKLDAGVKFLCIYNFNFLLNSEYFYKQNISKQQRDYRLCKIYHEPWNIHLYFLTNHNGHIEMMNWSSIIFMIIFLCFYLFFIFFSLNILFFSI